MRVAYASQDDATLGGCCCGGLPVILVDDVPGGSTTGANPRSYMRRDAGCEIWIWGAEGSGALGENQLAADYDVLNALINQTALSLYRYCGLGRVLTITGGSASEAAALAVIGFVSRIPVALVLGWLFLRRGSIWVSIGLHATFNAILLVLGEAALRGM